MRGRKIAKTLLCPPTAAAVLLTVAAAAALVYAMCTLAQSDPLRIVSYLAAFYALLIWCVRLPRLVRGARRIKRENRYIRRWTTDPQLRVNVTLCASALWNGAYGAMQLGLGIYHRSVWYDAFAAYYGSLAVMRLFLARHTLRHKAGEQMRQELRRYRTCGWVFLFVNLALSVMLLYMIRQNRAVRHHEITTIAMAAYTFTSLVMATINVRRYRKYESPAMSAAKAISLASACVSMLTLENTMLATFGSGKMSVRTERLFLALSGAAVSILIVVMALYMIVQARRKLKQLGA